MPAVEVKSEETTQVAEVVVPQDDQQQQQQEASDKKLSAAVGEEREAEADAEAQKENGDVPCESPSPNIVEKSSSFKEESNHPADLKGSERKALNELKSKLEEAIAAETLFKKGEEEAAEAVAEEEKGEVSLWGVPLSPSKGSEGTDVVLLKFLRARDFKVADAFEMLKKTLQWRRDSKIDAILGEDVAPELAPAAYLDGTDREGHPVCYNIYGVFGDEEMYQKTFGSEEKKERFLRWRVQLMEKGIEKLDLRPGGVLSLLQINDLKNAPGPTKKDLRAATKEAVNLLQDNYPELVARNIFINVPFWYYAIHSLLSPFLTQRTKSKFVFARPARATDTLLKYIPAEEIPVRYGGFKRENDLEFSSKDGAVSELSVKPGSTETIEIPIYEVGSTLIWDLTVLGWEVNYKEEFVPADEGSYTIIVQKGKRMSGNEGPLRNTFQNNEPGKVVLTVENVSSKKKRVLYRHQTKNVSF
ncbi:hypothetical protein CRG98_018664 [Punica granatum]|uniref:Patellin-4 n=1 Tax=Punica granatum TaxID=22663 RepID=A0A2I0JXA3_PUNGR|nr:hypothetical protein CRG98_018664 [Punica granatum]